VPPVDASAPQKFDRTDLREAGFWIGGLRPRPLVHVGRWDGEDVSGDARLQSRVFYV
jgi:hypothetical protein